MLTPRGFTDQPEGEPSSRPTSARTRSALLEERRHANASDSSRWASMKSPRAARMDIYRADAVAAASSFMTQLVQQTATPADAAGAGLDEAGAPTSGVRSVPGVVEHCQTTFTSVCSKKMDPQRSERSAPEWDMRDAHAAAADAEADYPTADSQAARDEQQALPDSLPGGRPMMPNRRRRFQKVARTIGRCANVEGVPNPPRVWMRESYIHRPEVTTLDSYDIPVYSSFSGDKAFHPDMDRVLKKKREIERKNRQIDLQKLRKRNEHQREVAREFEATLTRVRQLKEGARQTNSLVSVRSEDEPSVAMMEREVAAVAPAPEPYDPHKAARTPRCSVPTRPSERLLSAAIRAAVDEAASSVADSAAQQTESTAAANAAEGNAAAPAAGESHPRRRPASSPLRRALSPAALAAKQALDFKVNPRPPSASTKRAARPQSASAAESSGPRSAMANPLAASGNGMDLFAMTRVHSSTPNYGGGGGAPTPPPPPSALNRPTSAHASKRTRPLSARAASRGADSPWGMQDNFAGGAFALQSASGNRSRPQSARAVPRPPSS